MVDLNVYDQVNDLNNREIKMLKILLLNFAAHANGQVMGQNLMFNSLDKEEENHVFSL